MRQMGTPNFCLKIKSTLCAFLVGIKEKNAGINEKNAGINKIKWIKEKYPKLNKTKIKILEIIIEDDKITQEEIAKKLRKTESTIYRNIKELKTLKIVERFGADKNGYWKINL